MGIKDWFKSKNQSNPLPKTEQPTDPVVMEPFSVQTGKMVDVAAQKNKYSKFDALINMDERLWSVIELSAIMVQKSYGGISLHTENGPDEGLSNTEENAILTAKNFAKTIDIPNLLYCYTKDLWKYGDSVDQIKFYGSKGIQSLRPLPMNLITAIDKRSQFQKVYNVVIQDPKWYVVDEQNSNLLVKDQILAKNRVLHISFDNRRTWTLDNLSRWTFNVWSHSPIESLKVLIEWKQNLIRNDVVWRNRLLPREHHKLDLSVYDPSKYTGTYAQR